MSETALVPVEQKLVSFYGDEITAVLVDTVAERLVYVPVRPICNLLGVDWPGQFRRLKRDPVLSKKLAGVVVTSTPDPVTGGGGPQVATCLPLDYLNGWLFGMNADRVKSEVRDKLILYQEQCYRVLADAFLGRPQPADLSPTAATLIQIREMGLAIAHLAEQQLALEQRVGRTESRLDRAATIVGSLERRMSLLEDRLSPGQPISDEQAAEISQQVKALAQLLTERDPSKNHYQAIFSELYRRFSVTSYKLIPQSKYPAVLTFLDDWRQRM
ncbi:MAG: phage antirepressor N-terminal domain-containing protein [Chloroflexota bacterium]